MRPGPFSLLRRNARYVVHAAAFCLVLQGWAVAGMVACQQSAGEGPVAAAPSALHSPDCPLQQAADSGESDDGSPRHTCAACFAGPAAALVASLPGMTATAPDVLPEASSTTLAAPAPTRLDRPPKSYST